MRIYFDPDEAIDEPSGADTAVEGADTPNPESQEYDSELPSDDDFIASILPKDDEEAPDTEEEPAEASEEVEEPDYDEAEYEDALRVIQRDTGFSLEKLRTLDPNEVLERAPVIKKRQADNDRMGSELQRLHGMVEAMQSQQKQTPQQAKPDPVRQRLQVLKEEYGDKIGELGDVFDLYDKQITESRQESSQTREQLNMLIGMLERRDAEQARKGLAEEFPALEKDEHFDKVSKTMRGLMQGMGDRYQGDMQKLMRDAAILEFGEQRKADVVKQLETSARHQKKSQPSRSESAPKAKQAMTQDEVDFEAFQMLSNKTPVDKVKAWVAENSPS